MERRTGFAIAGAVAMVLVAGAISAGVNLGLLGAANKTPVGKLKPTDAAAVTAEQSPQVITVEVRDPARTATANVQTEPAVQDQPVKVIDVPVPASGGTSKAATEHETETGSDDGHESDD